MQRTFSLTASPNSKNQVNGQSWQISFGKFNSSSLRHYNPHVSIPPFPWSGPPSKVNQQNGKFVHALLASGHSPNQHLSTNPSSPIASPEFLDCLVVKVQTLRSFCHSTDKNDNHMYWDRVHNWEIHCSIHLYLPQSTYGCPRIIQAIPSLKFYSIQFNVLLQN